MDAIRIQKVLAQAGVASRRAAEEMVLEGRVEVNGQVVTDLPIFVTPGEDEIRVDGRRLGRSAKGARKVYYLLNKPRGVVCTQSDPEGRPRAVDLVPSMGKRVYCVGRLDMDSTGLILLTNDGELTNKLTHPRYGVVKTYIVRVDGKVTGTEIDELRKGMYIDGKKTGPIEASISRRSHQSTWLEIKLREGRNREIRRVLAKVGHKVRRLKRTAIGPITARGLKAGHFRQLREEEVRRLHRRADGTSKRNHTDKGERHGR